MKRWYKSWKVWCILGVAVFLVALVPVGINEAYKKGGGYATVWTGSELLAYYGTILGATATIIALVGTISFTRCQILFERYIQSETEKWKEIENLFRDAIILAEPLYLTKMFYSCMDNTDGLDVCLKLETYLTRLAEAMNRLNITIEEKDTTEVNELMTLLKEVEAEDNAIAKEYDDLISYYWELRGGGLDHSDLIHDFVKCRDAINLKVENLHRNRYQNLLQCKKSTFAKIYDKIDKESKNILTARK